MSRVPSLAEEMQECERDYLAFLLAYSAGDLRECRQLAKVSSDELDALLEKHGLAKKTPKKEVSMKKDNLSKIDRIKLACGKQGANANEIHSQIGGSRGSLSIYLSQMKAAGELVVSGRPNHYVYRVPD